jgi:hypothetical protein
MTAPTPDTTASSISTNVFGIGHLLSDRQLAIPDYQRSYSWQLDEVTELWDDVQKAMSSGALEYFLGSVVTTSTSSARQQVIDGQQRLATVGLFYAAMRDIFSTRGDERASDVEREFLGKKNMTTRLLEPRLTLNADDNDVFQHLTSSRLDAARMAATKDSHRSLIAAYDFLRSHLENLVQGLPAESWQRPLVQWHDYLLGNAKVIEVHVMNENRAFVIFETLNDRGLNLSTADLLKGHLFGTSGDRIEEAKSAWSRAMAPFVGQKDSAETDTFLRHFWASTRGVARVKALYSEIRKSVDTDQDAIDLAKSLAISAPLWAHMFDRDDEFWKPYSSGAKAALETLSALKVEQCRPLVLAAMRSWSKEEVTRLLRLIVAWSIRWFVVGGGSAGVTERLYAEAGQGLSDGTLADSRAVTEKFLDSVPTDGAFAASFSTHTVRRGWLARYYLVALEKTRNGEAEPELVPNTDQSQVNLEHVLPKSPDADDWPVFSADELNDMKLLIGNQVLLRASDNTELGNGTFIKKKVVLAASQLKLTQEVGVCDDWTADTIRERGERLGAAAVKTWPRSLSKQAASG